MMGSSRNPKRQANKALVPATVSLSSVIKLIGVTANYVAKNMLLARKLFSLRPCQDANINFLIAKKDDSRALFADDITYQLTFNSQHQGKRVFYGSTLYALVIVKRQTVFTRVSCFCSVAENINLHQD
ncbi:hypothetical protein SprV_0100423800 [Sparganum proliferum]